MGKASKALVSVSVLPLVACLMMSGAAASEGQSRPSEPISGDAADTSEQTSVDQPPAGSDAEIVVTGTIRRLLEAAADRKSAEEGKSVTVRVDIGGRRILKK